MNTLNILFLYYSLSCFWCHRFWPFQHHIHNSLLAVGLVSLHFPCFRLKFEIWNFIFMYWRRGSFAGALPQGRIGAETLYSCWWVVILIIILSNKTNRRVFRPHYVVACVWQYFLPQSKRTAPVRAPTPLLRILSVVLLSATKMTVCRRSPCIIMYIKDPEVCPVTVAAKPGPSILFTRSVNVLPLTPQHRKKEGESNQQIARAPIHFRGYTTHFRVRTYGDRSAGHHTRRRDRITWFAIIADSANESLWRFPYICSKLVALHRKVKKFVSVHIHTFG